MISLIFFGDKGVILFPGRTSFKVRKYSGSYLANFCNCELRQMFVTFFHQSIDNCRTTELNEILKIYQSIA